MEEQSCWGKLSPSVVYDVPNLGVNIPTLLIRSQYYMVDKFECVDFTGLLDFKGSEVVIFCPEADRIGVDIFPVIG